MVHLALLSRPARPAADSTEGGTEAAELGAEVSLAGNQELEERDAERRRAVGAERVGHVARGAVRLLGRSSQGGGGARKQPKERVE